MTAWRDISGHCLCGDVTITVADVHDPSSGACHCRMCQRWSGGLFLCFAAQPDSVTVTGKVARYQSSQFSERAFCPRCGSHLWMRDTDVETSTYDLMPGLFDAARNWPLRSEIYVDGAMTAVRLSGDHDRTTSADYEAKNKSVEGIA
jgi:hypothetical protein